MRGRIPIMYSNRKIFRYLIRFIVFIILLNLLKWFYDTYFTFDDLLEDIKLKNLKSVQLLTGRFDFKNWELDELGETPFQYCPEKRCFAYRSLGLLHIPNEKADGIMVHGPNLWYLPSKSSYQRNPRQLWLFYSMEPQRLTFCSSHYDLHDLDDWFNITATFKYDSDLRLDYKQFREWNDIVYDLDYINEYNKLLETHPDPISSIFDISMKQKRKASVVWFVSHCETNSRRENYVRELQKYIEIDIYGNCDGYFSNIKEDPCGSKKNIKCFNKIMNEYKFYLAFENSLCQDYISEKFWKLYDSNKIFEINIVPIVRGARKKEYMKAINKSMFYINSDDYTNPKDLANYLNFLISNETAYLEYFEWKINIYKEINKVLNNQSNKIRSNWNVSTWYHLKEPFCKICSSLHNETYLESNQNKKWKFSEWYSIKNNCWDKDEERIFIYKFIKFFGFCF